jgi:hypothetical protein
VDYLAIVLYFPSYEVDNANLIGLKYSSTLLYLPLYVRGDLALDYYNSLFFIWSNHLYIKVVYKSKCTPVAINGLLYKVYVIEDI